MKDNHFHGPPQATPNDRLEIRIHGLSQSIWQLVSQGLTRIDFLKGICELLTIENQWDYLELRLRDPDNPLKYESAKYIQREFTFAIFEMSRDSQGNIVPNPEDYSDLEQLYLEILSAPLSSIPGFTPRGSFWTGDVSESPTIRSRLDVSSEHNHSDKNHPFYSLAIIPLSLAESPVGIMILKGPEKDSFDQDKIDCFERLTETLSTALFHQKNSAALHERIKELTCLYNLAMLGEKHTISIDDYLQEVVQLIPPAWHYVDETVGNIYFDGRIHSTHPDRLPVDTQSVALFVNGEKRGYIETGYLVSKPHLDEGPFLKEERNLLNTIARAVSLYIEKRESEEYKSQLQHQLRHSDRLATIGQLAAGIAHELNEPLSGILGFAQLIKRHEQLPDTILSDTEKIIASTLHAREIVRKLLLFSKQTPPKLERLDLNSVIEESFNIIESRIKKESIILKKTLTGNLPFLTGDGAQLRQVIINLVVNAIQAMPGGGSLHVSTALEDNFLVLTVKDTGVGMDPLTQEQIFVPFFSTKDVHQGTGLGLSVAHGIVTSHHGRIDVTSTIGKGTCFRVYLPIEIDQEEEY